MSGNKKDPIVENLWWQYEDQMKHCELQDAIDTVARIVKHIYEKGVEK